MSKKIDGYLLGEIVISIIMIMIQGILWLENKKVPEQSAFYPNLMIGLAFILTVVFLITRFVKVYKKEFKEENKSQNGNLKQVVVVIALTILYLGIMPYIGYALMTPVFIFACLFYLGMRKKLVLFLIPVGVTAFAYLLFNYVLYVFLPRGIF